jgi:hypothetical protein
MTVHTSDSMIEGSMERLHHVLEHPSTVDSRTVEFVENATSRLFDLEHYSPVRLLEPTVDRHLATILPYSDTRAVRELLPQLTRLNRTADLENEAEARPA